MTDPHVQREADRNREDELYLDRCRRQAQERRAEHRADVNRDGYCPTPNRCAFEEECLSETRTCINAPGTAA